MSTNPKSSSSKAPEAECHGFSRFAARASAIAGSSPAFLAATAVVVLWGVTGPYFHFSDTWQLVINTGTTVVTFLMVFLIQNTQNRDARALHLKLDEVIRALRSAHNEMIDIERLSDQELERLADRYEHIRQASEERKSSTSGQEERPQEEEPDQEKHARGKVREKQGAEIGREKQGAQRKAG